MYAQWLMKMVIAQEDVFASRMVVHKKNMKLSTTPMEAFLCVQYILSSSHL